MRKILFFILLSLSPLHSTEDCPWFRTYMLPYLTFKTNYQTYSDIAVDSHNVPHWGNGFEESLSIYLSPLSNWCFELEASTIDDRDRGYSFDHGKLTGRYLLYSDLLGDPFSLAVGLSFSGVSRMGIRDRSVFHSGKEEYSFHTAIGKEISCGPNWVWHFWGVAGVGIANKGSPWVWGKIAVAKQLEEWGRWDLFASTQCGFGNHVIDLEGLFPGYVSIRYRSIDIGGAFAYQLRCGEIEIKYQWRAWAQNCPDSAHQVALSYIWPWSL